MNPTELRELLRLKNWTQKELARQIEVNEGTVSKWLSGVNPLEGPPAILLREWLKRAMAENSSSRRKKKKREPLAVGNSQGIR
jgi:transcriptional regulator with XRE-family HTH domain